MHQSSKQQIEDEDQQHKLLNFKASKVYPVNAEHNKCFNPSCQCALCLQLGVTALKTRLLSLGLPFSCQVSISFIDIPAEQLWTSAADTMESAVLVKRSITMILAVYNSATHQLPRKACQIITVTAYEKTMFIVTYPIFHQIFIKVTFSWCKRITVIVDVTLVTDKTRQHTTVWSALGIIHQSCEATLVQGHG